MSDRHRRRDPERRAEAEKIRMSREIPQAFVGDGPADLEEFVRQPVGADSGVWPALDVIERLRDPKNLPVTDLHGCDQYRQPAAELNEIQDFSPDGALDIPDRLRQRPPLKHQ